MDSMINQSVESTKKSYVIGFALDVSGSMKSSIGNSQSGEIARLEGLKDSLDTLFLEAERLLEINQNTTSEIDIYFFAYAYGLTLPGRAVCDLFQLIESFDQLNTEKQNQAKLLAEKYKMEYERKFQYDKRGLAIELMGADAYSLLSLSRSEIEQEIKNRIEQEIKNRIYNELLEMPRTLTTEELAKKWKKYRESISTSNELLGGDTPMKECLRRVKERFEIEKKNAKNQILFVISDGESTDGNPVDEARKMALEGVQIISCCVSSSNVLAAKTLYNKVSKKMTRGARTMFDISTQVSKNEPAYNYLIRNGWKISQAMDYFGIFKKDEFKIFAQINHSDLLKEFIKVILEPIKAEHPI